jgi:hypothetical protein
VVKLSALVCVQNQDTQLAECLRKLSFCDEVVVVADRCTDRSQEIARREGCIVIDGIFPLESQRKAAGAARCTGDWILEIDPDERVDAALAWEIRAVIQMQPRGDWYDVPVDNYVGDHRVRRGWTGPLSVRCAARLHRRGVKAWEPSRLESDAALAGTHGGSLKGAIRRVLGRDAGGLIDRLNRLSGLAAEDLADRGQPGHALQAMIAGVGAFAKAYLLGGGWREGRLGVIAATASALFPMLSQARAQALIEARAEAEAAETSGVSRLRDAVGFR